jgi:hypothetical protein
MELVKQIGKKKFGVRPPMFSSPCPFCGKTVTVGRDNRSFGFRKIAHSTHVFACYEKELLKLGFIEGIYNAKVDMHVLESCVKLTKKQAEVISLMRQGWGLAFRHGMVRPSMPRKHIWIQEGGIGKGGTSIKIKEVTLTGLAKNKLIERTDNNFLDTNYQLTELGKTCSI